MRKIAKHKTVFNTHSIDASHIYAGFDHGGNICVAMQRDHGSEKYNMVLCLGHVTLGASRFTHAAHWSYFDTPSVKLKNSQCEDYSSLQGTLSRFSEVHSSDIYEFDTFLEFCKWVIATLSW